MPRPPLFEQRPNEREKKRVALIIIFFCSQPFIFVKHCIKHEYCCTKTRILVCYDIIGFMEI